MLRASAFPQVPARPAEASLARRHAWSLAAAAALIIAIVVHWGAGERSAWVLMTAPDTTYEVGDIGGNWLLGYSGAKGDAPLQAENFYSFVHLQMFSGGPIAKDYYAVRPIYPFLSSLFAPVLGWQGSMLFVNMLAWALAPVLVFLFCRSVTGSRPAAFWSALLALAGLGFVAHAHDYSAHLLAFTFYFGAVFLVHESRVWRETREWPVHAALGAFLAVAALEYNTGLVAIAGYAVAAIRRNGLVRVGATAAAAAAPAFLWPRFLNLLSGSKVDYGEIERYYREWAVAAWRELLDQPAGLAWRYAMTVVDFLSYEMPLLMAAGLLGIAALVRARRSLDFAVFVFAMFPFPVLALAAYAGPYTAKGYLTFQTAIFVYAGAGFLLWRLSGRRRILAVAVGGALVAGQLAWNLSYLLGVTAPIKLYFLYGFEHLAAWLPDIARVPDVLSLTGIEPTPRLFGGAATLHRAGLEPCAAPLFGPPDADPLIGSAGSGAFRRALMVRAPFALLISAAAWMLVRSRLVGTDSTARRRRAPALIGFVLLLVGPAYARRQYLEPDLPRGCMGLSTSLTGRDFVYTVDVSPDVIRRLENLPQDVRELEIATGFRTARASHPDLRVAMVAGDLRIELGPANARGVRAILPPAPPARLHVVDREALVRALRGSRRISLEVGGAPGTLAVEAWQRNDSAGRRLFADGRLLGYGEQRTVPFVEIRARRPGELGLLLFAAF